MGGYNCSMARPGLFEPLVFAQYVLLKKFFQAPVSGSDTGSPGEARRKLEVAFGPDFLRTVHGKAVLDFGCGCGWECIEVAKAGARKVIGLDIREHVLEQAQRNAAREGVLPICEFTLAASEPVELIISLDAFEHFADPGAVLRQMEQLLLPGGEVFISFGPPWLHPLGGHLCSVFPWAHILLSERALLRWRSHFRSDGATRFEEVEGGLNRMTIRRFKRIVASSPFRIAWIELVPIRKVRALHNRITQEFFTSIVRSRLVRR